MPGRRGVSKQLGEFRTTQSWTDGTSSSNARFVPPLSQTLPESLHFPRVIQGIFSKSAHLPSASGKLQLTPNTEYGYQPRSGRVRDIGAMHSELRESQDTQNTTTKLLPKMFSSHGSLLNNLSQWRHESSRKIMERVPMREFRITNTGDELGHSCVPPTLLPNPPIQVDGMLNRALAEAVLALGRLDGISSLLPDASSTLCACPTLVKLADSFSDERTQQHRSISPSYLCRNEQTHKAGHSQRIYRQPQGTAVCVQRASRYTE